MKKGDKVSLRRKPKVTGIIIEVESCDLWGAYYDRYLVQYDNDDLVPPRDWHDMVDLDVIQDLPSSSVKCECGASKVMGLNAKHSSYCPLYS